MAEFYRDGRVLPEWSVANVDRVVCAASAALVSRRDGVCHTGDGTGTGVDAVPSAPVADCLFLHCDSVADWGDPDCELYVPELSCARHGGAAVG